MPARILSSVDLPVPLPPTRPVRSSGVMSQLASSKRSFWPKRLPAEESWSIPLLFSHWLRPRIFWDGRGFKAQGFRRIGVPSFDGRGLREQGYAAWVSSACGSAFFRTNDFGVLSLLLTK